MDRRRKTQASDLDIIYEIGVIVAAVVFFFASSWAVAPQNMPTDTKLDTMFAVGVAFLAYLCGAHLTQLRRFRKIDDDMEELRQAHERLGEHEGASHQILERLLTLLQSERVLRQTGYHALGKALSGFSLTKDDPFITVSGQELTFETYAYFWKRILELQKEPRFLGRRRVRMVARLTHSSEIGPWGDDQSESLRKVTVTHGEFRRHGGTVFRIFLDNGKTGSLDNYERAIKEMERVDVHCAYMRWTPNSRIEANDFKSDFCIIDPDEYSSDWFFSEGKVDRCEIGRRKKKYEDNRASWTRLVEGLRDYEYKASDGLSEEQLRLFEKERVDFLKAAATAG